MTPTTICNEFFLRRIEKEGYLHMLNESAYTKKIHELLKDNGISSNCIKTNHKMGAADGRLFEADIAIVDNSGKELAVIEVKAGRMSEIVKARLLSAARLFSSLWPNVLFFAVCDDKAAELTNGASPKWNGLEDLVLSLKKRLGLEQGSEKIYTLSRYFKELKLAKGELDNRIDCNNASDEDNRTVKYFFRGQSDYDLPLVPSLFRSIANCPGMTYYEEEQYLIQEAERVFPAAFSSCKTDVDRMTVAQHYEIPTRLLDVSGNALVALYFAAQPIKPEKNGAVYVFRASPHDFRFALEGGRNDKITIKGFHDDVQSDLPKEPWLIFPSFRTQRQTAQDGAFYLFGNETKSVPKPPFTEGKYFKVKIPKGSKLAILAQLKEECNIHMGTLFPDSLAFYSDKIKEDAINRIKLEALVEMTSE